VSEHHRRSPRSQLGDFVARTPLHSPVASAPGPRAGSGGSVLRSAWAGVGLRGGAGPARRPREPPAGELLDLDPDEAGLVAALPGNSGRGTVSSTSCSCRTSCARPLATMLQAASASWSTPSTSNATGCPAAPSSLAPAAGPKVPPQRRRGGRCVSRLRRGGARRRRRAGPCAPRRRGKARGPGHCGLPSPGAGW